MSIRPDAPSTGHYARGGETHRHRGQSLVELAITVPLLLMILLGTVDVGRMFFGYIQLRNAAFEGARYAMTVPTDTSGITTRVLDHGVPPGTTVAVACSNGDCTTIASGSSVTVTVTAHATFSPIFTAFIQTYLGIGTFTMTGTATTRVAT